MHVLEFFQWRFFRKKLGVQKQNWNPITTDKFSDGEDQLEKWRSITMCQGGEEYTTSQKKKKYKKTKANQIGHTYSRNSP